MVQLRLHTLGGLVLLVDGEVTTGTATQRRRLALLALLEVARSRGLSRDKILAYLWPESSAERARHGLNQLLYAQRRFLGVERLFLGNKTLRLDRELMAADVWEFDDACDSGASEEAVRLYGGPFLDGFFLRGAPEFERWVESERRRLAQRCVEALDVLATAATAIGDHPRAAEWWRRAVEVNPFDTVVVIRLVEARIAAGDSAGAMRQAQQHQELLRTQLGLAPHPKVAQLIGRLRGNPES